jgi:uncharacterized surface protein with fasciclin (FAS1) repeats
MLFKALSLAALASIVSAQTANLTSAIAGNPSLTNLTESLSLYPQLVQQLSALQNVTLLAPSNAAFAKLLSTPGAAAQLNNTELITAIFTYHVLNGSYYSGNITSTPAFIPTILTDPTYSQLRGQRVEAVTSGSNVLFYSGLLTPSTVTQAVCFHLWKSIDSPTNFLAEYYLYWRCHSRCRHLPYPSPERFHKFGRPQFDCRRWCIGRDCGQWAAPAKLDSVHSQ